MPDDWTKRLTEVENDNLVGHLHDDQCDQCWVVDLFCTLAASRALVEELKATIRCKSVKLPTSPNCLAARRYPCSSCAALALKEADMLKRLEVK